VQYPAFGRIFIDGKKVYDNFKQREQPSAPASASMPAGPMS